MPRSMITTLTIAAAVYLIVVLAAYLGQRSLMYFPSDDMPQPADVGMPWYQAVGYPARDGLPVGGWYAAPTDGREARFTIVHFHGNGGSLWHRAPGMQAFREAGHAVLLAGYRGYDGNPGRPDEAGLYADGHGALDFLVAEGVPEERIVVLGESLGSGVAVRVAAERKVAAVLLEAPFSSAVDVARGAYFFLPVDLLMRDRYPSVDHVARIDAPLHLVHGELDRIVPVRLGRRLFEAAVEPKQALWLPGHGHNDLPTDRVRAAEIAFLAELAVAP